MKANQEVIIDNKLDQKTRILKWVDHNKSAYINNEIWHIGIASEATLMEIQSTVLANLGCVHWKYWSFNDFTQAFKTLGSLTKSPSILKSNLNDFISKGKYVFIYKTRLKSRSYLNLTTHYYGRLKVSS